MKLKIAFCAIFLASSAASVSVAAIELKTAPQGTVQFDAVGKPSFVKIHGKGGPPSGQASVTPEGVAGKFSFDLSSLDTGIEMRNHHMKEKYLETAKYPQATLTLDKGSIKAAGDGGVPVGAGKFKGILALHGQEKPVEGTYNIAPKGGNYELQTSFNIKLSEFGVEIPKYLGITVADNVDVKVNAELAK